MPQRSTRRNVVVVLVAVAVLAAVWASPAVLKPSVQFDGGGGMWSAVAAHDQVLTIVDLEPNGFPSTDIRRVVDQPGAHVVGAWVITSASAGFRDDIEPGDFATGLDYVAAALEPVEELAATALPRSVGRGTSAQLVVLWSIADCSLLVSERPAEVELRTLIRTSRHEQLDIITSPGFSMDTLADTGIRPGLTQG